MAGKCMLIGAECPRTNNTEAKRYCPAWSDGVVWRNAQTNEERVVNCSFQAMMPAMVEVIAASNRPAAAVESTRNEIAKGFQRVANAIGSAQAIAAMQENLALEDQTDGRQ